MDYLLTDEQYNNLTDQEKLAYNMYGHNKDKIFNMFKNLEITEKFEYVGTDHIFNETVEIYKLRD